MTHYISEERLLTSYIWPTQMTRTDVNEESELYRKSILSAKGYNTWLKRALGQTMIILVWIKGHSSKLSRKNKIKSLEAAATHEIQKSLRR